MSTAFEAVIGLEVHAQLSTDSKIFCSCPASPAPGVSVADVSPNQFTCPVCTAQPGALPVMNRKAVEYAVRAGLATHCTIRDRSIFARKNYFYPDLPKGYQISQYDQPICEGGFLEIGEGKKVRIKRIHLEEDAGKSIHERDATRVNLNRAGVPLVEIVSEPDLSSAEEAGQYLRALHAVVTYLEICDGNMQEGNFRCDANVSLRPAGSKELGTRTEIKNVNSFRFVEKAIEHEIERQSALLQRGEPIVQETRGFDSDKGVTYTMRSKEEAHDYRYFPDPDLLPIAIGEKWVEEIRKTLPELPEQKKARWMSEYGLSEYDSSVLASSKSLGRFFEQVVEQLARGGMESRRAAKPAANFLTGEVLRLLKESEGEIHQSRLRPEHIAELVKLSDEQVVSSTGAKQALLSAWKSGDPIATIVDREGLRQVSDLSAIEPVVAQVIEEHPAQVAEFRAGKEKVIGFLVGQVMKRTGGKANPGLVQQLLRKKI